ncbi:hypothetical protein [Chryseobacterium turcicum]|uniref:DUF4019 domain-containing protein n=1 Tax=Chryseobacterium turcicum TaxID=2898076 RepID=A0A9Q3V209_9FLAO|nr:hypothetical protein [Chryseobacterium turcicum]MCD1118143.1 hypothetical protein [Chryseobacterium turcicum]
MKIYITLSLLFLLLSCDFKTFRENNSQDIKEAEKVTESYYSLVEKGDKEELLKLFSKDFFESSDKNAVESVIDWQIQESKKPNYTYTLIDSQTLVEEGTDAKSEYVLTYSVQREFKTKDKITLIKENDDKIRIFKYEMTSEERK